MAAPDRMPDDRRPDDRRAAGGSDATRVAVSVAEELLSEVRPGEQVRVEPTSKLERELGFDSLSVMELRERMEAALGVSIADDAVAHAETLNDLLDAAGARTEASADGEPAAPVREAGPRVAAPPEADTLPAVLDWYAEHHPDRLHLRLVGEQATQGELTFSGLRDRAARVAAGLQAEGVEPGQTVALMLPTSLGYFESFFGAMLAGAVPVPIYPPARPSQLEDHLRRHAAILSNAEARVLVTVGEARNVARLLRAQVGTLGPILTPDDLSQPSGGLDVRAASPDDLAMLQYTSGSTATPKGVRLTHANLLANIHAMAEAADVTAESDVFVSWLPLYHDMGLIGAWLGSLTCGIPLVVMSPFTFLSRPVRWLQAMQEHRGTISPAPNFAYELCCTRVADDDLEGLDLSSWRLAVNGAEPVSAHTLERFRERYEPYGLRRDAITPVYGLAESAVGLAFPPVGRGPRVDRVDRQQFIRTGYASPAEDTDRDPLLVVGCGSALPGHDIRIVGKDGRPAGDREQGRIQFRGPSATPGYHRNPDETRRLFDGSWLETGDLGYLSHGELHVTGRVKDMIIRAGRNLHPQELEEAVGALDEIRTGCVAAFAAADPASGTERLVVVAETRETDENVRSQLRRRVAATVSDVAGLPPDEVVLAVPRAVLKTSSGKIRRGATRERWEAGQLDQPPAAAWHQVARVIGSAARPQLARTGSLSRRAAFGGLVWLVSGIVGAATVAVLSVLPARRWRWSVARGALRLVLMITGVPLRVEGVERLPDGPCILVAPHGSPLDGPSLVAALPKPLTFVVIQEVGDVPVIGRLLRRLDVELIDREDRSQASSTVDRFIAAIRSQPSRSARPLVLFPESTMSAVSGLRPFRMGAFVTAARTGVPVVPVAIKGTREMVGPHGRLPRPGRIKVLVGEAVHPRGAEWADAVALRDRAREELLRLMDVPDLARG